MFIHAETALLPTGWATNVRLEIADGKVSSVTQDVEAVAGDERHAVLVPAMPNLHSHAFQRAMAGMVE
ncbi:MAG: formimidoylglutamate deiminase, partial [Agrobacterium cavarae]